MGELQVWRDTDPAGDFFALTRKISLDRGFGCASYKDKCLRRRIAVRMRARGVHTYEEYAHVLDGDAVEYDRLLDALTINVTKLGRVQILGTDIDRRCLEAAQRGQFEEGDFSDTPDELRRRYFSQGRPFTVVRSIRNLVRFESRDLLRETPPSGPHDLIVCRNVLIYFDRETQERLFDVFYESLAPNGFLVLGKVEMLLGHSRSRFAPVDARERIFRRV